jgi:hypothetical protein
VYNVKSGGTIEGGLRLRYQIQAAIDSTRFLQRPALGQVRNMRGSVHNAVAPKWPENKEMNNKDQGEPVAVPFLVGMGDIANITENGLGIIFICGPEVANNRAHSGKLTQLGL